MYRSKCFVLAVAVVVFAASCGGGLSEAVAIDQPEIELIDGNALRPTQFYGLIDQQLLSDFDGSAVFEVDRIQTEAARACMAERGFEFPVKPEQAGGLEPPEPGISELEFAQTYGLGVAYFGSQTVQVGPTVDYISEHIAQLTPNEADSFGLAYYGETSGTIEEFDAADEPSDSCLDRSLQAAGEARAEIASLERMDLLSSSVAAIDSRFRSDSRTIAAYGPYGSCMRDVGYAADLPVDAIAIAQGSFGEFLGQHRKIDGAFDESGKAALQETIEDEIRIALASLSCEASLRPLLSSIYRQVEADWIDQNAPVLAALGSLQ